jgi:hypothetical protein
MMRRGDRFESIDNHGYQESLAASLIDSLGVDGAVHACQANAWFGVLNCVLAHRDAAQLARG